MHGSTPDSRVIAATFRDDVAARRAVREVESHVDAARTATAPHADGFVVVVHVQHDRERARALIEACGGRIEADVPEAWL